jgi:hypothetical protein
MEPLLVVVIEGQREVTYFDKKEQAVRFALKQARKQKKLLSVNNLRWRWEVTTFLADEWQGWHYSQLLSRLDPVHEQLVATPSGLLRADQVPVVFEDGNCPGLCYLGTVQDQLRLQEEGGCALPVCSSRIVGNKVFVNGPDFTRREYIGDPDYDETTIVGSNPYDWELVDIRPF